MSAVEITGSDAPDGTGSWPTPRHRRVVVVYEGRAEGRAALMHAHSLAADRGVPLTVATVAHRERTDIGCGSCRQGAAFRNEMACEWATEELTGAREVIASMPYGVTVDYVIARGSFARAVDRVAAARDADLIVLPARRPGRLRRLLSRDRVRLLERRSAVKVLSGPA
jgi:nucleotide-binding universal stress UspA family protein